MAFVETRAKRNAPHFQHSAPHDHAHFEKMRRTLRWQLLVAYAIPFVLISLYFHYQYSKTLETEVHAHLKSIAENQRNTVDLYLRERIVNVSTAFRTGIPSVPTSDDHMRETLSDIRRENDTFSDLGLFDPQGTLVAYAGTHESLRGRSYSQESWFRHLHDGSEDHYVSDVFLGFRGRPHFVIAVRRTIDGEPWTLRASVDPQRFSELIGRSHLGGEGEAFIINSMGERQTSERMDVDSNSIEPFLPRAGETSVVELESEGQRYIAAVAWLAEHDWAVVVRVTREAAMAPLLQARIVIAAIVLIAVIFTVLLAMRSTRRLIGELEKADTAKEMLRRQLFNAAKLASVGEMAAGVAHEINNPLAIVREEAGLMIDILDPRFGLSVDHEEFRERLGAIMSAALRGRDITSKLLAFSRRHEVTPQPCDLNDVVQTALKVKDTDFRVSDIETVVELDEELPEVMVNRNELEQVLLNLLNNARDAIGRFGVISIRTMSSPTVVSVRVEDTGCGMTEKQIDQAFFPFFTTKEVGKGTGLGLSISLGIIESFGGWIDVESEEGVGTAFTISLPISVEPVS